MTQDHDEARLWADNHQQLSDFIGMVIASVRQTAEALVAIQYAAPWKRDGR